MKIFKYLKEDPNLRDKAAQALMLYGSLIISMGLAFVSSLYITRYLSPSEYGEMKFITTVWYLLNMIVSFGFFHSAGQTLLHESDSGKIREITGTDLLVAFFMGCVISGVSVLLAKPIDMIFNFNISDTVIILSPLLIIFPLKDALSLIFQCTNRIKLLSILNIIPPALFLVFVLIAPTVINLTVISVSYAQQISFGILIPIMIAILQPKIKNSKLWFKRILEYQKGYGTPVYVAVLCSVATQQLNRLGIAYWVDSASVGFYSLATQLVDPLRLIPSAVGTSSFRDFSTRRTISKKIILATLFSSFLALLAIEIVLGKPLLLLYPQEYAISIGKIGRILAIGSLILGFAELLNRFLGAHAKGKELRNTAVFVGILNIVGFLVLTPLYGIWGTIVSTLLASLANLWLMLHYYNNMK